jgi:DNA (cytosine-5)-methyltransferase 1
MYHTETLFFRCCADSSIKRPCNPFENVKNLSSHGQGNVPVRSRNLGAANRLPCLSQHDRWNALGAAARERIIIVGFREETSFSWDALSVPENGPKLGSILHTENGSENLDEPYISGPKGKVHSKYVLTDKLWAYLQAYAEKHRAAGNGFGFGLVGKNIKHWTLSARNYKDGSEFR